ncbi:MAG: tRNA lysidine(34) synthetase TilS, partial [Flavobacteriaceae bacterium]
FNKHFATKAYAEEHGCSIQMAARELRYQWFSELATDEGFDVILTAHHLNDQLETFLMHMFRGTGPPGLLGIPETNGRIQRPLLPFTKAEILNYAKEENIRWREDDSNATDAYQRNRVRHHLLPTLEKQYPLWSTHFQTTLDWSQQQQAFVTSQIADWKARHWQEKQQQVRINLPGLQDSPHQAFLCHRLFSPFGFDAKEVQKLLVASSGKALFTQSHRLQRERDYLQLDPLSTAVSTIYALRDWTDLKNLPVSLNYSHGKPVPIEAKHAYLDPDKIVFPLQFRQRREGDFLYPTGMKGKKLLSKFYKDSKYSQQQKEEQWLLCKEDEVIWVVGVRCNQKFVASEKNLEGVLLTFAK